MDRLNNVHSRSFENKLAILAVMIIGCICIGLYIAIIMCCFPRISTLNSYRRLIPDETAVTAPNVKPSMLTNRNTSSTPENHNENNPSRVPSSNIDSTEIEYCVTDMHEETAV